MPAQDKYSNLIQVAVTQSAANTLTFTSVDLGLTIFQKVGIVISRMEIYPQAGVFGEFVADGDTFIYGLTQSNQITTLSPDENSVVYRYTQFLKVYGAATAIWEYNDPITADFSTLPGGGLIIAPRPLYAAVDSNSVAGTPEIIFRIYFTIIELKADEYFELLESRRFFG